MEWVNENDMNKNNSGAVSNGEVRGMEGVCDDKICLIGEWNK